MTQTDDVRSWRASLRALFDPRVIKMLFLGFSAGMPLLLVFGTLSVWLREAGAERATIGYFSWAALAYGLKFVWAPLLDRYALPLLSERLGHRRGWLLATQIAVLCALAGMAYTNPAESLAMMAALAVMLGFASASQDIVIDAYRIESAGPEWQGLMSAMYVAGYRFGMVLAGAGALEIAGLVDDLPGYVYPAWRTAYLTMAAAMLVGICTTLVISEPARGKVDRIRAHGAPDNLRLFGGFLVVVVSFFATWILLGGPVEQLKQTPALIAALTEPLAAFLIEAGRFLAAIGAAGLAATAIVWAHLAPRDLVVETFVEPFADFIRRYGKVAIIILALIALYRIADLVMGVMANTFYTDMGFAKEEIGRVSKVFGILMTMLGGFVGGVLSVRFGVLKILFLGAVLAAASNLLFSFLASLPPELLASDNLWTLLSLELPARIYLLSAVVAADNLSGGIATTAFIAFLSSLANVRFSAVQYALFSSMMLLLPKLISGYSGAMVDSIGYSLFFILTALMGIPVLWLIWLAGRHLHIESAGGENVGKR